MDKTERHNQFIGCTVKESLTGPRSTEYLQLCCEVSSTQHSRRRTGISLGTISDKEIAHWPGQGHCIRASAVFVVVFFTLGIWFGLMQNSIEAF